MGLGEAEPRVDDDLVTGHPGGHEPVQALGQLGLHPGQDAPGVVGEAVHGPGVAAPVLADVDHAGGGHDVVHARVGQAPRDVVDHQGPGADGGRGGGGVDGVHAHHDALGGQGLDDGEDALLLGVGGDALGTRPGGLAPDVEQVSALVQQGAGVGDGGVGGQPAAAVGEGVRGDVDDAHDQGAVGGQRARQRRRAWGGGHSHVPRLSGCLKECWDWSAVSSPGARKQRL